MATKAERIKRTLLFTIFLILYSTPFYSYQKDNLNNGFLKYLKFIFIVSAILSIGYALLCLCWKGFVDKGISTAPNLYSPFSCSVCMQYKPERAHHCSRCRRCIKKMDHHCHWIGRCINYYNLGHFIRFLLFALISYSLVIVFNIIFIVRAIRNNAFRLKISYAITSVLVLFCSLIIFIFVAVHLYFQLRNAAKNITQIEVVKKQAMGIPKSKIFNSIYDMGFYENLKEVFGPVYKLFLWMPDGDGVTFKKNSKSNNTYTYEDDWMLNYHVSVI